VRPRQKDLKFKATLDYIGRPCLKKQKKQNKIKPVMLKSLKVI
jgi:hypothetical protein